MSSEPRRADPLPLGDRDLPYSKGMMARALIAAASIGINGTRQRILLFALAAAIAGLGGGLIALQSEHVDSLTYPALFGVALYFIHHDLKSVHYHEVAKALRAIPSSSVARRW